MADRTKERISSISLLLFSVFICFFSYRLSLGAITSPGPGFFPFYTGIILGLLSINAFAKTVAHQQIVIDRTKAVDTAINWRNIIFTVLVLFCFPLILYIFGFLISTFLFTILFLRFINPQRWWVVVGMGGAVASISYFVFQYWLKIQFPSGILGI